MVLGPGFGGIEWAYFAPEDDGEVCLAADLFAVGDGIWGWREDEKGVDDVPVGPLCVLEIEAEGRRDVGARGAVVVVGGQIVAGLAADGMMVVRGGEGDEALVALCGFIVKAMEECGEEVALEPGGGGRG